FGGFECSCHRRRDGVRLDLLRSTRHDQFVHQDYHAMRADGIRTVRDGIRWHLAEPSPGRYDWSHFLLMLDAAKHAGIQPLWDVCHYGWPDDLNIWSPAFVTRFAHFAAATAAIEAIRDVDPRAQFIAVDPIINVVPNVPEE